MITLYHTDKANVYIIVKFDTAKVLFDKANVTIVKVNVTFMIRQRCNRQTKSYPRQHARIYRRSSSTKVIFHWRSSSTKWSYFTKGCLSLKVFFQKRSSSIEGRLPPKVDFHRRLSSIKGCLPLKVIFHRRTIVARTVVNIANTYRIPHIFYASFVRVMFGWDPISSFLRLGYS